MLGAGGETRTPLCPAEMREPSSTSVVVEWGAGFSQVAVMRLGLSRPAEWHQRKPAETEVYAGDIDTLLWTRDGTSVRISTRIQ